MQRLKVADLKEHPRNKDFFEDMTGEKWEEFVKSIKASNGPIESIIVTEDMTIVSGHQRVRACKELGIEEIWGEVHAYNGNELEVVKDLIETNVRQRGVVGGSDEQIVARVEALKQYYGTKQGTKGIKLQAEKYENTVEQRAGTTRNAYNYAKASVSLNPEVKQLVETGVVAKDAAIRVLSKLSPEDQLEIIRHLDTTTRYSREKLKSYISKIEEKDNLIATLIREKKDLEEVASENQAEAAEAVRRLNASQDGKGYVLMKQAKDDAESKYRQEYENHRKYVKETQTELAKTTKERDVALQDNRRLSSEMDELRQKMKEMEEGVLEVAVPPKDYEEVKAELKKYKDEEKRAKEEARERAEKRKSNFANELKDWSDQTMANAQEAMRDLHLLDLEALTMDEYESLVSSIATCATYFKSIYAYISDNHMKESA